MEQITSGEYSKIEPLESLTDPNFKVHGNDGKVFKNIDYLSIDTEGSEYEILSAFPFEKWNIRLITVEHNFTDKRRLIQSLMTSKGYGCKEIQWDDWYEKF